MTYNTLVVEPKPPLAWIRLNRPERLNALDRELARDLRAAVGEMVDREGIRIILLRGEGRAFSSGGDLRELRDQVVEGGRTEYLGELVDEVHATIRALWESPKPIVAAVHGVAAGAGLSLALACDFRLASEEARFQMSFINIGLVADSGSTYLLPRLVGMGRAVELALTGEQVSASQMERFGALNRVVPEGDLIRAAEEFGGKLARKSSMALGHTKRLLHESWGRNLFEQLDAERDGILDVVENSPEFAAAIRAFLERSRRGGRK